FDNTDRNRTSPFAFTGNRFEFRAPGSSSNCAMPMIVLNTAVAQTLEQFKAAVDKLEAKGEKKDVATLKVIRKFIIESKKARFEGNGYSPEWLKEAAKRGLKAHTVAAEAFKEYLTDESVKLFTTHKVLNRAELEARYEIKTETLLKKIQIESRVIVDMASNHIIPTAIKYQNLLIDNVRGIKEIFPDKVDEYAAKELETLAKIAALTNKINESAVAMTDIRRRLNKIESIPERALKYEQEVSPNMISLRKSIDDLEMIVDDDFWPLVKYREILAAL
ncbi:MAG: glutamine synthetase type III, partial [Bacteroidales bacterium]|nr:glutamine synthetase type III [Bacteroidales bacterium]